MTPTLATPYNILGAGLGPASGQAPMSAEYGDEVLPRMMSLPDDIAE